MSDVERDKLRVERDTYQNAALFHANKAKALKARVEELTEETYWASQTITQQEGKLEELEAALRQARAVILSPSLPYQTDPAQDV